MEQERGVLVSPGVEVPVRDPREQAIYARCGDRPTHLVHHSNRGTQ